MVLKLYGSAMSTARVLVIILELDLPYEHIPIDFAKGEQHTDGYKQLQPFGKVPVLVDEGFVMFESRAICRYLVRKYSSGSERLMPNEDDAQEFARFETFVRPKKGLGPPDQARISQALQDFEKTLAVYDDILSRQKYLAGDNLTIADLFHLPQGAAMEAFGHKEVLQRYRHVTKWFDSLQARKSWA